MRAHLIENGVVVNTIEVNSLDFMPGLVKATSGGIGWLYDGTTFIDPNIPTKEEFDTQQAEFVRAQRNTLLLSCDWTQVADAPVDQNAWKNYRQVLRDIPDQPGFPLNIIWPTKP